MNIVITMAGRGSRFVEQGFSKPKPLIDVYGKPMFCWALQSLPLELSKNLIFICLADLLENSDFEKQVDTIYSQYNTTIIPIREVTDGQAATALKAEQYIDNQEGLIIFNIDTYFISATLRKKIHKPVETDGVISVFWATGSRWSFARTDERGHVLEVAEKKAISNYATTGMYHFSKGHNFISAAHLMIDNDQRVNNEFYVAPIYNILIQKGYKFIIDLASKVFPMGTPADLESTERLLSQKYPIPPHNPLFKKYTQ